MILEVISCSVSSIDSFLNQHIYIHDGWFNLKQNYNL